MTALLTRTGTGGRHPNTSALGHSVGLLQDVLDPREAAIPSTALAQWQHEPWFPATLVPLKVQKSGGFRGPGSSLFVLYGGNISLRCLQSLFYDLSSWINPGEPHFVPKEIRLS